MCGIAGFYGDFSKDLLEKMQTTQSHRGPDDCGLWHELQYQIGFAHNRLSIIDLTSGGHQPMHDPTGRVSITYNGEIYNYLDLKEELIQKGHEFKSSSDTEVLVHLYLEYGEKMLSKINGMFAFGIFDKQEQKLFLAKDQYGVKPLYYTQDARGVLFASELKALLQDEKLGPQIDQTAVALHLSYLWCPSPQTMLKSVKKLAPGMAMTIGSDKKIKSWRYYVNSFEEDMSKDQNYWAREINDKLEQSVKRQLIADVEVGAFLSGGLDSSSIAYYANQMTDHQLSCFTIDFDEKLSKQEGMIADLPFAKAVAKELDVNLKVVKVGPEFLGDLDKMIYHLDEPVADPACLNQYYISRLARENGIKVLLSGAGGDDLFSGYRRHFALAQEKYWEHFPKSLRKLMAKSSQKLGQNSATFRRVRKALQYSELDATERIISYFWWTHPEMVNSLVLSKTTRAQLMEPMENTLQDLPVQTSRLNQMLFLEQRHFLADHNLNYGDKMSMAASVEVRVPFLDPDLINLSGKIPIQFKQRGSHGKWIFKKAMEGKLPHDVIYRPKTGFGVPLRHWLKNDLRDYRREILSDKNVKARGLFNATAVAQLNSDYEKGKIDATYTLFSLMCMERWCQIFVDKKGFTP